jgi:hypothetical protein
VACIETAASQIADIGRTQNAVVDVDVIDDAIKSAGQVQTPVSKCQRGRFITFGNTRSTDRRGIRGDALDVEVNVGSRGGDIPRRRHVLGRVSIEPSSSRQLQATADASQAHTI